MQAIVNNMSKYSPIAHGADHYNFKKNISTVLNNRIIDILGLANETSRLIFQKILEESKEVKPRAQVYIEIIQQEDREYTSEQKKILLDAIKQIIILHHGMSDNIKNSKIENAPAIASQLTDDLIKEVLKELNSDKIKETEQVSTKDSYSNKISLNTSNGQKSMLYEIK
jgi:hypothetical protein